MRYLTKVTAFVEVLYVPKSASFEDIADARIPYVAPDFTAVIGAILSEPGVRKVQFVDTEEHPDPNRAGVEYELRLLVHAREYVGPQMWQTWKEQCRQDGEPMDAVTIVSDDLGFSDYTTTLGDLIRSLIGKDYDVTVADSFDVQEAA
ncbi:hypothetical protein [Deinococcus sp. S9]|uniref:hypothetical protein n=1 Tax=Deinococcus sp. S9 TaxID=2545754 RepID=UPI0010557D48|nr:hypothetical protein [Deinococcus sp. S9]TDE87373.1 hypothetical protein E0686_02450 [Deinococcus sp. S9]